MHNLSTHTDPELGAKIVVGESAAFGYGCTNVAGADALYKANNPGASSSQVKSALQNAGSA